MEDAVKRRVVHEEKAYRIVEHLAEIECVTEEWLLEAINSITPDHYKDAVEERAIAKVCGYPLCASPVEPNRMKKQYQISSKQNKVFDITERKNFCSNACYRASKYFENQIPESPVWARDDEIFTKVSLLSHHQPSLSSESQPAPSSASSTSSSSLIVNLATGGEVIVGENDSIEKELKELEKSENLPSELRNLRESMQQLKMNSNLEQTTINPSNTESPVCPSPGSPHVSIAPKKNYVQLIQILFEWRTERTVEFLLGYSTDNDLHDDDDDEHETAYQHAETAFEKLLNSHRTADNSQSSPSHRLPAYEQLCHQAEQLRVDEASQENERLDQDTDSAVVLPLVDSKSQGAIRSKIITEKLISILKHFVHASFGLAIGELATEIKLLSATFQASNENIVLKPAEWTKLGVLLILLLKERARILNQPYLDRIDAEKLRQFTGFSSEEHAAFINNYINI